ncbi:MAG: hypothetical protein ACI9AA_003875, partial [Alteromonas sp.]
RDLLLPYSCDLLLLDSDLNNPILAHLKPLWEERVHTINPHR